MSIAKLAQRQELFPIAYPEHYDVGFRDMQVQASYAFLMPWCVT